MRERMKGMLRGCTLGGCVARRANGNKKRVKEEEEEEVEEEEEAEENGTRSGSKKKQKQQQQQGKNGGGMSHVRDLSRLPLSGQLLSGANRSVPEPAPPRPSNVRYVPALCQAIRMKRPP